MLEAVAAAWRWPRARAGRPGVLGETVLTSLDAGRARLDRARERPGRLVARLARVCAAAGIEGVVCGTKELGDVAEVAPGLIRVTSGIRPDGAMPDDQRRIATPAEALDRGRRPAGGGQADHRGAGSGGGGRGVWRTVRPA